MSMGKNEVPAAGWGRLALATLVGGSAMWVLAGLWHTLIAAAFYTSEKHATHQGTGIILVAYLVLGLIMAWLYPRVRGGGRPVWEGLKFGVVIGLLWVFPHELAMAGAHGEPIPYVLKNAAWHVVEQGVGGMILALVFGRVAGAKVPRGDGRESANAPCPGAP